MYMCVCVCVRARVCVCVKSNRDIDKITFKTLFKRLKIEQLSHYCQFHDSTINSSNVYEIKDILSMINVQLKMDFKHYGVVAWY